jgi:hypothetical protein
MCTGGFQIFDLNIASINAKKFFSVTLLIVFSLHIGRLVGSKSSFLSQCESGSDPDPGSETNADQCSVFIVEPHGSMMAFRGARNMRMSVGSMNPFQTMGKADFTLIDPR